MTLDDLRVKYDAARAAVEPDTLYPAGKAPPNVCRYCGMYWAPWAGSNLDGHAKCMVPAEFKRDLAAFMRHSLITYLAVAQRFGVSESVVRGWCTSIWGRR